MSPSLVELLADPETREPLTLLFDDEDTPLSLRSAHGDEYPVVDGVPCFVTTQGIGQQQTGASFGFKWNRIESYEIPENLAFARNWLTRKYGFDSADEMRRYFSQRSRILDAGCGSGFSSSTWLDDDWDALAITGEWIGVDISSAIHVAQRRLGNRRRTHFVQADVLHLPFPTGTFDCIFSEGVLHHTPSTEQALREVVRVLADDGEILFYIYRRKSPVREFTDDYVRDRISAIPAEDAWELLKPLTQLGKSLAELDVRVTVPEPIEVLGIPAGEYDVQRLIYWHFAKMFWNPDVTFDANLHVNFDWYHPKYAHRHTAEEVLGWCDALGLRVERFHEEEAGFAVRAVRQA